MNPDPLISKALSFEALLGLMVFATKYMIWALHNQVIDILVDKVKSNAWAPTPDGIEQCYKNVD